jgi:hypothetical protein
MPVEAVFVEDTGRGGVTGGSMHVDHSCGLYDDVMAFRPAQHPFENPFRHKASDDIGRTDEQNRQIYVPPLQ